MEGYNNVLKKDVKVRNVKQTRRFQSKKRELLDKQQIKQMIDSHFKASTELKWFAVNFNSNLDYGGTVIGLTSVTQGDTDQTRDGDSLNRESIDIPFQLIRGDITNAIRIVLFSYGLNTVPTPSDIWTNLGSSYAPYGIIFPDAQQYVKVLSDRLYSVGDVNTNLIDTISLKLSGKMQFASSTSTGTNKIYMFAISDSAAASHPTIVGSSTLRFRDA